MTAAEFNKLTTIPFRLLRPSSIDFYFNLIQQGDILLRLVARRRQSILAALRIKSWCDFLPHFL
jgi:hypothetical protein